MMLAWDLSESAREDVVVEDKDGGRLRFSIRRELFAQTGEELAARSIGQGQLRHY